MNKRLTQLIKLLAYCSLPIICSLNTTKAQAVNLIINGDFEAGNVNFSTDYDFSNINSNEQQYTITSDPQLSNNAFDSFGDHTTGNSNMMVINGAVSPDQIVWQQTVSVLNNTVYDFSAWIASAFSVSPANLEFSINSVPIGSFVASTTTGLWQEFTSVWNSGSNTSAQITIVDTNLAFIGNDFTLDDISFQGPPDSTATPEPTTLFSLGLLGLGLGLTRKKQK